MTENANLTPKISENDIKILAEKLGTFAIRLRNDLYFICVREKDTNRLLSINIYKNQMKYELGDKKYRFESIDEIIHAVEVNISALSIAVNTVDTIDMSNEPPLTQHERLLVNELAKMVLK